MLVGVGYCVQLPMSDDVGFDVSRWPLPAVRCYCWWLVAVVGRVESVRTAVAICVFRFLVISYRPQE